MIFTRQLATLIDSGLPLLREPQRSGKAGARQGFEEHHQQTGRRRAKRQHIFRRLAQHPRIFNDLYVNMVKAGELGGVLEVVLNRLAGVPGESREDQEQGAVGDGLSDHRDDHGRGDHVFSARFHRAEVRSNFSRHARRQTAAAGHAVRYRRQQFREESRLVLLGAMVVDRGSFTTSLAARVADALPSIVSSCACRSSAT